MSTLTLLANRLHRRPSGICRRLRYSLTGLSVGVNVLHILDVLAATTPSDADVIAKTGSLGLTITMRPVGGPETVGNTLAFVGTANQIVDVFIDPDGSDGTDYKAVALHTLNGADDSGQDTGGTFAQRSASPSCSGSLYQQSLVSSVNTMTFARTGDQIGTDSGGDLQIFSSGNAAFIDGVGVLLEDAATNLVADNVDIDSASSAWGVARLTTETTHVTAPDGTTTATVLSEQVSGVQNHYVFHGNSPEAVADTDYTASMYGKEVNQDWLAMRWRYSGGGNSYIQTYDLANNVVGVLQADTAEIQAAPQGFSRMCMTFDTGTDTGASQFWIMLSNADDITTYVGVAASQASQAWAPQLEVGTFATSVILSTTTSQASRVETLLTETGLTTDTNEMILHAVFQPQFNYDQVRTESKTIAVLQDSGGANALEIELAATTDVFTGTNSVSGETDATLSSTLNSIQFARDDVLCVSLRKRAVEGFELLLDDVVIGTTTANAAQEDFTAAPDRIAVNSKFNGDNTGYGVYSCIALNGLKPIEGGAANDEGSLVGAPSSSLVGSLKGSLQGSTKRKRC